MVSAINSAVAGLTNASKRFETSAQNIAQQPDSSSPNAPETDTAQNLVNAQVASYDYKANLNVIKVADQMQQSLLDIKA